MKFTSEDLLKAMGLKVGDRIQLNDKSVFEVLNINMSSIVEIYCTEKDECWSIYDLLDKDYTIIQPKPTLTEDENSFLKVSYNNGYRYLAKDRNEKICRISKEKPTRLCDEYWTTNNDINHFYLNIFPSLFQFIKWEDEPYSIEELLKE